MGYVAPTWQNGGPPALNAKNMQDISDNLAYVSNNMVNPKILDNWYFGNPVNQRGQTSYTGVGYGIDRWKLDIGESVTIDNGLNIVKANSFVGQYFDDFDKFIGRQLVGSVLMSDGDLYTGTFVYNGVVNQAQTFFTSSRLVMYINKLSNALTQVELNTLVDNVKVLAVGLELGSQQTLAHQENGVWVLNEIPDYGEQLRRCQRYCFVWGYGLKQTSCLAVMQCVRPGVLFGLIPTPVTMRNNPVVTGGSLTTFAGNVTSLGNLITCANGIRAVANIEGTSTSQGQAVGIENADDNGRVIFSADL